MSVEDATVHIVDGAQVNIEGKKGTCETRVMLSPRFCVWCAIPETQNPVWKVSVGLNHYWACANSDQAAANVRVMCFVCL